MSNKRFLFREETFHLILGCVGVGLFKGNTVVSLASGLLGGLHFSQNWLDSHIVNNQGALKEKKRK